MTDSAASPTLANGLPAAPAAAPMRRPVSHRRHHSLSAVRFTVVQPSALALTSETLPEEEAMANDGEAVRVPVEPASVQHALDASLAKEREAFYPEPPKTASLVGLGRPPAGWPSSPPPAPPRTPSFGTSSRNKLGVQAALGSYRSRQASSEGANASSAPSATSTNASPIAQIRSAGHRRRATLSSLPTAEELAPIRALLSQPASQRVHVPSLAQLGEWRLRREAARGALENDWPSHRTSPPSSPTAAKEGVNAYGETKKATTPAASSTSSLSTSGQSKAPSASPEMRRRLLNTLERRKSLSLGVTIGAAGPPAAAPDLSPV